MVTLTVVQGDDVKTVHQLSLVFVDTLHLAVEHGVDINSDAVMVVDVVGQCLLVPL